MRCKQCPLIPLAVLMSFFRLLSKRRRLALLGTTVSGTLAGIVIVSRVLPGGGTRCLASCSGDSPEYRYLQRREAVVNFDHPRISSVYVNNLPSNSPNEDRYVAGGWGGACTGLFGVIDGHKSDHCSEHLKNTLLKHVMSVFVDEGIIEKSDNLNEYNLSKVDPNTEMSLRTAQCDLKGRDKIDKALKRSFSSLDNKISEDALKCVRMIGKGRSIKEERMLEAIMKALAGACALLSVISSDTIYIASTGDCRAVLGTREGVSGEWSPLPLSIDQNSENKQEVSRLKGAHPGEENVIIANRLLGGLMPFRSFGDIDYKWLAKDIRVIASEPPYYNTPPYLTAEPVVTAHPLSGNEKFLVLATDGLWERLPNDKVVNAVASSLYGSTFSNGGGLSSFFRREPQQCCDSNPATSLIWEALGGEEKAVGQMLNLPATHSRMYRDDITVIVIKFK